MSYRDERSYAEVALGEGSRSLSPATPPRRLMQHLSPDLDSRTAAVRQAAVPKSLEIEKSAAANNRMIHAPVLRASSTRTPAPRGLDLSTRLYSTFLKGYTNPSAAAKRKKLSEDQLSILQKARFTLWAGRQSDRELKDGGRFDVLPRYPPPNAEDDYLNLFKNVKVGLTLSGRWSDDAREAVLDTYDYFVDPIRNKSGKDALNYIKRIHVMANFPPANTNRWAKTRHAFSLKSPGPTDTYPF